MNKADTAFLLSVMREAYASGYRDAAANAWVAEHDPAANRRAKKRMESARKVRLEALDACYAASKKASPELGSFLPA